MKEAVPLFISILLFVACNDQSRKESKQLFTYKKGLLIAHWTGGVAPRYMGKSNIAHTYGASWFDEEDVKWIANQGLDHIQIRLSGKEISDQEFKLDQERISVLDDAITWSTKQGLGTIITLMDFPEFEIDSTLSMEEKSKALLREQATFWEQLASHFSPYSTNVRFILHGGINAITNDIEFLNEFNSTMIAAIRLYNKNTVIYMPTLSIDNLDEIKIPKDEYLAFTVSYEKFDIFCVQHMGSSVIPDNIPTIKFPSTVPDLTNLINEDHWLYSYSELHLNEKVLMEDFGKIVRWKNKSNLQSEFYIPTWGYFTGWPLLPEAIEDKSSIINYSRTFSNACKLHNIHWAIYDYNSGMPIRMENNEASILLNALDLGNK